SYSRVQAITSILGGACSASGPRCIPSGTPMPRLFLSGYLIWICAAGAQDTSAGRKIFEARCSMCHGGDANGGEFAGSIVARVATSTGAQLSTIIRSGVPGRGMPPVALTDTELEAVLAHLRTLRLPSAAKRERT